MCQSTLCKSYIVWVSQLPWKTFAFQATSKKLFMCKARFKLAMPHRTSKRTSPNFSGWKWTEVRKLVVPLRMLRLVGMVVHPKQEWCYFHIDTHHHWRQCIPWSTSSRGTRSARTTGLNCRIPIDTWGTVTVGVNITSADKTRHRHLQIVISRDGCNESFLYDGRCLSSTTSMSNDSIGGVVNAAEAVSFASILQNASGAG